MLLLNHVALGIVIMMARPATSFLLDINDLSDVVARLESDDADSGHKVEHALSCAKDFLNQFCQLNWTSPRVDENSIAHDLLTGNKDRVTQLNSESLRVLCYDGEAPYSLCKHPILLCLSQELLLKCRQELRETTVSDQLVASCLWWLLRCFFIQQKLLGRRSATLWEKISEVSQELQKFLESKLLPDEKMCELQLELGHVMLYYSQYDTAQKHFEQGCRLARMTVELTGALGKRTRFQQKDVAQLLLKVESSLSSPTPDSEISDDKLDKSELPKDLMLRDDTLLEHVQFTDPQTAQSLTPLQQAALLGVCTQLQMTTPVHRLSVEEREAYVNSVLVTPQCWVVQFQALLLRCQLEKERRRTVERAMSQLQELVDSYNKMGGNRMQLFYCTPIQPWWVAEKELADVLVSLGLLKEALEVYERLELWEEIVVCYQAVGRGGKAEEIIHQQLAQKETPIMWCLLGDVTKDPQFYLKAWELSNHRSARAQRSLGLFYLRKEQYKEAIESLQLSLQVNALQESLWFSLGCAANVVGDNDLAVKSFHRCVTIEPDFAEAWSNLASAYLKRKDKVRAFHVYKEALKCSYDNWKIWENFLLVCADVGEFEESIKAYHRLLDLKEKFVDVDVMGVIVRAVVSDVTDRNGQPASRLRKTAGELLGRIAAQTTVSADMWKLYAEFHFSSEDIADHEKGLLELQKAQRATKLETGWEKELSKLKRVVSFTMDYCQACRKLCAEQDQTKCTASLSSAKLALQSIISKTKGFGLRSSAEIEELVVKMEEEKKLLLEAIDQSRTE